MSDMQPPAPPDEITDLPKSIVELEKEARERVQAKRVDSAPKVDIRPDQPEVSRLKHRSKNRLLTLGIGLLAALIFFAWAGDWAYNQFFRVTNPKNNQPVKADPDSGFGQKRLGMGLGDNSREHESKPPDPLAASLTTKRTRTPTLNKSMALEPVSTLSSNKSEAGSRANERKAGSSNSPATIQPYQPCPVRMVNNAEGVLRCPVENSAQLLAPTDSVITGAQRMTLDPDLYIPIDTYIPCTMQTRFVSDVAGRISCLISEDIYSESTHVRLIPAGTRARGVYKTGTLNHGQARMFVMWTELRTPDRLKIPMIDSQVVGQLGEAGIDGWVDTHFWQRFGNALMLSTVQDVAAAASSSAPSKDRNTDYTENSRAAASEMAKTALENSITSPPTIYKNQGDIIGIMTGADIDFSSVYRLKYK